MTEVVLNIKRLKVNLQYSLFQLVLAHGPDRSKKMVGSLHGPSCFVAKLKNYQNIKQGLNISILLAYFVGNLQ